MTMADGRERIAPNPATMASSVSSSPSPPSPPSPSAAVPSWVGTNILVVLVLVALGLFLNTYAKGVVNVIQPVMPFVAMICTSLCIGRPLAINRSQILSWEGLRLLLPILTFHLATFTSGYWLSKLRFLRFIRLDTCNSRDIEVRTNEVELLDL